MGNGRISMYHFIVNRYSMSGKSGQVWDELEEILKEKNVDYVTYTTKAVGHATDLAREITSAEGDIQLGVFGGDGTLNEVLNGIVDFSRVEMTYIPCGSANDFAKGVGITGDPTEVLKRVLETPTTIQVDLGQVNSDDGKSRIFGVSAGIGVDALVCKQVNEGNLKKILNRLGIGEATYGLTTVGDICTMPFADGTISYGDYKEHVRGIIFAAAMNSAYEGGGIPMVPYANPTSGVLSALVAHDIPRLACFPMLLKVIKGKHQGTKGCSFYDFDEMKLVVDKPLCDLADGEHVGFHKTVSFKCLPGILKLKW